MEIRNLPCEWEQELTSFLFSCGCQGTEQILQFEQDSLQYEPRIVRTSAIDLRAYFKESSLEQASLAIQGWVQSKTPGAELRWKIEKQRDWLKEWKKHFKPFAVGSFWIEPSWIKSIRKPPVKSKRRIRIEPGMAFGTGSHATTRFALNLLEELRDLENWNVADVGAGSGILSVAAEQLGAAHVDAVDNDPEAWRVCRENLELNKTKHCRVLETQVADLKKNYDLVLANIIDGVLMQIGPDLRRLVRPGGFIILSGILTDGAPAFFRDFFGEQAFEVVKIKNDSEWTASLARRKNNS